MSKYVVLSFDDGRLDTYTRAIPIMLRYGLTATINITTDFILNPNSFSNFLSSKNRAMTIEMIKNAKNMGFEIAGHSHTHCNDINDIRKGLILLREWGVNKKKIGFASPYSSICSSNFSLVEDLINNEEIAYVRSGIQVRREGYCYALMYILQELTKSNFLFYLLNKKQIFSIKKYQKIYSGVTITSKTTIGQIKYLIDKMRDDTCIILIMHSILEKNDKGYGVDKWYFDSSNFASLCNLLASNEDIKVITNGKLRDEFNV